MDLNDPPPSDILELSLFGPGVGECCLIHVGGGRWIVVDSCKDGITGANAALTYLERIGVEATAAIELIVATHAHDDHIAGISEIVDECPAAEFVCPAAVTSEQFFALLEADEALGELRLSVYSEFRKVNALMAARQRSGSGGAYRWAMGDRPVFGSPSVGNVPSVVVTALSPSDAALTRSLQDLGALLYRSDGYRRRIRQDPNTLAVALWLEVGGVKVLLGSDVLTGPGQNCGWNAVLSSPFRPSARASVFKVPHHGSPTAHHDRVWSEMLDSDVLAVVAPYRAGRHARPDAADRRRIANLAGSSYITTRVQDFVPRRLRPRSLALGGVGSNVTSVFGASGQIRLRTSLTNSGPWGVELASPAEELATA